MDSALAKARWEPFVDENGILRIVLGGNWTTGVTFPPKPEIYQALSETKAKRIRFDTDEMDTWDSSLIVFLSAVVDDCDAKGIPVDVSGIPQGARRLLALATSDPQQETHAEKSERFSLLVAIGEMSLRGVRALEDTLEFIGELGLSIKRLVAGQAKIRSADVWDVIQECGWKALPIVSLISLLVGLILAFMGAVQLRMFGAQIYVADLVGIGMTREMGAVMTGVIMAGRTGAAFAANLGTMQVSEEIDALQTIGVNPTDYLVLPRITALVLMMPLLCVYADFMGLLGGMTVSVAAFDISAKQYVNQTLQALTLTHIAVGICKSVFFGIIVAMCGCMQGIRCGRSAAAVGQATTSAVVISIVLIVVADGIFAVVTDLLGI